MTTAVSGLEPGESGLDVGRDPRKMSRADFEALGHEAMSPLAALRAHCIDCCGGSPHEVRLCTAVKCPSWPFRMGSNPWRAPASEAQRQAGRRLAARMPAAASNPSNGLEENAESAAAVLRAVLVD